MDLEPFGWAIGISDINDWRECAFRMADGMQRHVGDEPPEHRNWTNAYGSAIHEAIHIVETESVSHEEAIRRVMATWAPYLEPGDAQQLREDLDVYERRRTLGVTLVAAEKDMRVPLFVYQGQQIYFRFKLDVLQRSIANPSVFLHRDYKSTKWPKSPQEVHSDPQLWAYNWGIHERWPECVTLLQTWDGLRFGEIPTTKNDEQRAQMKQWLIDQVTAIIEDGKPEPRVNDFCRYCRHVVTCPAPRRASRYFRGRLAMLAPMTKEGRKVKVEFGVEGDELAEIIRDELPQMMQTRKHIEHVEKLLKDTLQHMPIEERERLRWRLNDRRARKIAPDGLRALHEIMGDSFYALASLSMSQLEELYGKPKKGDLVPRELAVAREWTVEEISGTTVVRDD